jgi:hypothetical protein
MENQENNSSTTLKIIIGFLTILLLACFGYIYQISIKVKEVQTALASTVTDKELVIKDLKALKATYDDAIAENTSMSDELNKERQKVVDLIGQIEQSNGNLSKSKSDLEKYKIQYLKLKSNMKALMLEKENLVKQNRTLTKQRDSTITVLDDEKKNNQELIGQNENLSKTIEKGSKLTVLNLQMSAYKLRSSGKQIATEKARRADMLKISFTIAANQIAKVGEKEYYVQVIDSKYNVLGEKLTVNFDEKTLTYSFISKIKYENKTVSISKDLKGENFADGVYFVNIFDKSELVSSTSFTLK